MDGLSETATDEVFGVLLEEGHEVLGIHDCKSLRVLEGVLTEAEAVQDTA